MNDRELVAAMPKLKGYARRLTRNEADAEDLAQDAVVKAIVNRRYYRPESKPANWLCELAFRLFVDHYRRNTRQRKVLMHTPFEHFDGVSFRTYQCHSHQQSPQEKAIELRDALARLAELSMAHRDAVLMAAAGYTLQESARMAGVPVGTMRSRVHYGRAKLMEAA